MYDWYQGHTTTEIARIEAAEDEYRWYQEWLAGLTEEERDLHEIGELVYEG